VIAQQVAPADIRPRCGLPRLSSNARDWIKDMDEFPDFMKKSANMVDPSSQFTRGIEGYVFDGIDGSQMAFWTYGEDSTSVEHEHDYDEYIVVVQGQYRLYIDGKVITLGNGDEYHIPSHTAHGGEALAGTRAIYAFGGNRAKRVSKL